MLRAYDLQHFLWFWAATAFKVFLQPAKGNALLMIRITNVQECDLPAGRRL